MKVSEFLNNDDVPSFLLGAFYGRYEFTKDNSYIYTYSAYRNWTKVYDNQELCDKSKISFLSQLNNICKPFSFWIKGTKQFPKTDIVFALENDLNLTKDNFFNRLNRKIVNADFIYETGLTETKKIFIRGFSELRGSLDRNRNLLSMDYVKNSQAETKRVRLLIDNLNVPVHVVNYNFREFQPDFQQGKERETQLRYNVFWYAQNIGFINEYRIAAFKENFYYTNIRRDGDVTYFDCPQPLKSDNTTFENRIAYYSHNVFGKKLTSNDMSKFKELIGANDTQSEFRRDASIVNAIRYGTDDICACCCDDYDIKNRSHIERNTGRYHFEIHHMISVGKNKELDDIDNLAKICPACHAILGRGSADEETQKNCIRKIFKHKPNILQFCKSYFDENDYEKVVDLVWKALK